mmetsp:Transcript_11293/g.33820  ORF Transcript_11293/g.33820 Transcript_11293/m.33820 type:complete len:227 (+) Transcript_11293:1114-1794(+)
MSMRLDASGPEGDAEFFVDHEGEDAHLGGAAVVEFDAALEGLLLLGEGVPAEVEGAVAEVTGEFARGGAVGRVLHDDELEEADEGDDLGNAGGGDGAEGAEAGRDVRELGARVVDGAREEDAGLGGDLAEDGEHTDAAVLDLDVAEAVELLLVGVREEAEGIPEAEGRLDAELGLEGLEGRRAGGGRGGDGGREGEGRGREGRNDEELREHLAFFAACCSCFVASS